MDMGILMQSMLGFNIIVSVIGFCAAIMITGNEDPDFLCRTLGIGVGIAGTVLTVAQITITSLT